MILNIFNGFLLGIALKFCVIILTWVLEPMLSFTISKLSPTFLKILTDYLWLLIITASLTTCIIYKAISKKRLEKTQERRFHLRVFPILLTYAILMVLSELSPLNHTSLSFLWALSLLKPDTIAITYGFTINLLAILSISAYTTYAIILGRLRRSINTPLHLTCALTLFALCYNGPSGFFLFLLIQSICLLRLTKSLIKIIEPKN